MGIYKGTTKVTGTGIQVDTALSSTSNRAVINAAITSALNDLGYNEWIKPDDWIDIRSGALPNSVYFLVGHSADYSQYPAFAVTATISNSGTYDVYVDGIKQATTANNTTTTLNWQTLALTSGYDVTYPVALRTHVVQVTPTVSTNTIEEIRPHNNTNSNGCLWAHFSVQNSISIWSFCVRTSSPHTLYVPLLEAVTSTGNKLKLKYISGHGINYSFQGSNIKALCDFDCSEISGITSFASNNAFQSTKNLKKVNFINCNFILGGDSQFNDSNIEKIYIDGGGRIGLSYQTFRGCTKLQKLPPITYELVSSGRLDSALSSYNGEPSFINVSSNLITKIDLTGSGIKGVTVSNEAPFSANAAPQLNVSNTGMDRAALVNLFKSMPYNVGYEVVGNPTITNGVASGFGDNNYITLSQKPTQDFSNFEIQTTFTMSSAVVGQYEDILRIIKSNNEYSNFYLYTWPATGRFRFYAAFEDYTHPAEPSRKNFELGAIVEPSLNYTYYIKVISSGNSLTAILYNKTLGIEVDRKTEDGVFKIQNSSTINFGTATAQARHFSGSIDLNETYIKVNGVPWFTGKAAMTKTCNVVGCTGTADLTAEDKAIATDKGWALTLS